MTFEFAETNINGQERYMLRSYVPNRLANGEVVGIFVLIRDITERRRTAEALHQAYQHLEQRVRRAHRRTDHAQRPVAARDR